MMKSLLSLTLILISLSLNAQGIKGVCIGKTNQKPKTTTFLAQPCEITTEETKGGVCYKVITTLNVKGDSKALLSDLITYFKKYYKIDFKKNSDTNHWISYKAIDQSVEYNIVYWKISL